MQGRGRDFRCSQNAVYQRNPDAVPRRAPLTFSSRLARAPPFTYLSPAIGGAPPDVSRRIATAWRNREEDPRMCRLLLARTEISPFTRKPIGEAAGCAQEVFDREKIMRRRDVFSALVLDAAESVRDADQSAHVAAGMGDSRSRRRSPEGVTRLKSSGMLNPAAARCVRAASTTSHPGATQSGSSCQGAPFQHFRRKGAGVRKSSSLEFS